MSMTIVNLANDDFRGEKGRDVFPWRSTPPINSTSLNRVSSEANFDESLTGLSSSGEQPDFELFSVFAAFTWVINGIRFLVDVLIKSTIGFPNFLRYMGHPPAAGESGVEIVPSFLIIPITTLVYIIHLTAIVQILGKFSMRDKS